MKKFQTYLMIIGPSIFMEFCTIYWYLSLSERTFFHVIIFLFVQYGTISSIFECWNAAKGAWKFKKFVIKIKTEDMQEIDINTNEKS